MKLISICIPCYNEEKNIPILLEQIFASINDLKYDFEIIFTDNDSSDGTVEVLSKFAEADSRVKVLVNNRNYGIDGRSGRNTFKYVNGEAVICMAADCQDPPELIPKFLEYWEQGYKVVCGQKEGSEEGIIKYKLRSIYYNIIARLSEIPQIKHISGITLLDKEVINEWLKTDYDYYLRFALADMGYDIKLVPYIQRARKNGKSSYNMWKSLTFAINSMVTTSTTPIRMITILGLLLAIATFLIGVVYLIMKMVYWHAYPAGTAPILIGMFFLGAIQLFMLGIIGEYIGIILKKVTRQPNVIIKKKINIKDDDKE